ncbi:protoporphyrinogen oxidase [Tumebacillus algifaecis]|uniref:Coproporphyrinogen III oxidase n=1 Tax=Tumebacillus algifaecis TaxID=1214604 RepID=A0A223CZA4_9BACL|nr:protoporphyrinogen oxidase [Tumebacillus algifaecis]ASS74789.1 protoporphyrinogen oxidase [Tumebacillus algifaecis]
MEQQQVKTVVVIGGGITGMSTAYYLEQKAREQGIALQVYLLEADDKLGGKVQTVRRDGFVIEAGPDSFLARKPAGVKLCRELGIDDELVGTNPNARKTYILHQGKLHRIPQGLNIGVPTQFVPFATTGLLSWGGKLRAGLDLIKPKSERKGDESLGAFLERRLGNEVVDRLAEPLLAGIYAGDLRKLSMRATFPQYEQLEQKYGSLIRGMLAQAKEAKAQANAATQAEGAAAVRPLPNSVFLTFNTGLHRLIERLEAAYEHTEVRKNTRVEQVEARTEGGYSVRMDNGSTLEADAVVITTSTYDAAGILPSSFSAKTQLTHVPYVSVATVVFAFDQGVIDFPFDASGFVVPKKEGRTITAATWTSSKWLHTAQDGKVLMRFYVGRGGDEAIVDEPDEEIIRRVRIDLKETMGITADPSFSIVTRWRRAMPQYTVGHLDRIKTFVEQAESEMPGVYFAGGGYTGLGIPDCIAQGTTTAEQVLAAFKR